jgi:enamine deaminase RidA (YjgF/YER057c/UK114 family)
VLAARGERVVFVSGQISVDRDGNIVGRGDLAAQTRQVFEICVRCGRSCSASATRRSTPI